MSHPYLRWLKIHRYERFDGVEIEFSRDENLILGVNGAGKTLLLRLLHCVTSFHFEALRSTDFDVEFEFVSELPARPEAGADGPPEAIVRGAAANRLGPREPAPDLLQNPVNEADAAPPKEDFSARLTITAGDASANTSTITVASGQVIIEGAGETKTMAFDWSASLLNQFANSDHRCALFGTPRWGTDRIFEDDRDFRRLIMDVEFGVYASGHLQVDYTRWRAWIGVISRAKNSLKLSRRGGMLPDDRRTSIEAITGLLGPLNAESLHLDPKLAREEGELRSFKGIKVGLKFESGPTYFDLDLTFGQRRYLMIGLFALLYPYYVFLIDELDNGLHPRLVEALMRLLDGRQRFFASHNKLVIDYTRFDSAEDIQRKVHVVRRDDEGRQHVDVIGEATAREVFESIEIGVMHPADVLQAEGLW